MNDPTVTNTAEKCPRCYSTRNMLAPGPNESFACKACGYRSDDPSYDPKAPTNRHERRAAAALKRRELRRAPSAKIDAIGRKA